MRSSKSALLAMASIMSLSASVIPANGQQGMRDITNARQADGKTGAKQSQRAETTKATNLGIWGGTPAWRVGRRTFPGGGWSVRQGQRMALKARNQKRHKAASRG